MKGQFQLEGSGTLHETNYYLIFFCGLKISDRLLGLLHLYTQKSIVCAFFASKKKKKVHIMPLQKTEFCIYTLPVMLP